MKKQTTDYWFILPIKQCTSVASGDTDIFISLFYRYSETWKAVANQLLLWWVSKSGQEKIVYPVHNMCRRYSNIWRSHKFDKCSACNSLSHWLRHCE